MPDTERMVVWLRETMDAAGQLADVAAKETSSADWEYQEHGSRLVATSPPGFMVADVDYYDPAPGKFMAAHDPAAVLRRITADRKTLEDCEDAIIGWTYDETKELARDTIRNIAEAWGWTEETSPGN
jgi:hypothetical protein